MEINCLLDTNILIAFLKGDENIIEKFKTIEKINISVISVGEMLFGAENSLKKEQNIDLYLSFFKTCKIFPITEKVASTYAKLRIKLKQLGKPIPENDLWIASTSFSENITLISKDMHLLELHSIIDVQSW